MCGASGAKAGASHVSLGVGRTHVSWFVPPHGVDTSFTAATAKPEAFMKLLSAASLVISLATSTMAQGVLDPLGPQIESLTRMNESIRNGTYPGPTQAPAATAPDVAAPQDCTASCQRYCGNRGYHTCYVSGSQCMTRCR
jgi:hypothetical protein